MARKPNTREIVLMAVLVGAVLIVIFSLDGGIGGVGQGTDEKDLGPLGQLPVIFIDQVYAEAEVYDPQGRDLFKYGPPPRPKEVPRPASTPQPAPPRVETPKPVVKPPAAVAIRPPEPKPPEIKFRYLGYLGPKGDKIAVFQEGEAMLLAREGEIVQKEFKVLEFKYESILMGYVDPRFKSKTTEINQEH